MPTNARQTDEDADLRLMSLQRVMGDKAFTRRLGEVASEIAQQSRTAPNEATVVSNFERILYSFLKSAAGFEFTTQREVTIDVFEGERRRLVRGRIDSRIGALVIEYKHKSALATPAKKERVRQQIEGYLESLWKSEGKPLVGIITDGVQAQVVRIDGGIFTHSAFEPLHSDHLERIIKSAILLGQTALTPDNLVADFCGKRQVAYALARALFEALESSRITDRSKMLLAEWKTLFHLAHEDASKQASIRERKAALGDIFGITIDEVDNDSEYRALYALQTAYAIIVKAIALNVLGSIRDEGELINFRRIAEADDETIRSKLWRIEEGDLLRGYGYTNLLEGDFFAWYCTPEQWRSATVGKAVRAVFAVLSHYEQQPFLYEHDTAIDFFKELYMAIMPDKVRHSLGEYYTPAWLADQVVTRGLELSNAKPTWRGVDPCCGSGTFVTTMLRKKLRETAHLGQKERLSQVVQSVKGLDLNPLAVLTARINYFINISPLLHEGDKVEIPIYLGDASYVPETVKVDGVRCYKYQIATMADPWPAGGRPEGYGSYIEVIIPVSGLEDLQKFAGAMTAIETHIKAQNTKLIVDALVKICAKADLKDGVMAGLERLASQFVALECKNWNGIWARIVADFLTTAALGKFDLVAGNPPWIDWRNLPSSYRERIKGLCVDRHLFSGDKITGGINLNVCALITSVAAGNWLSSDGVLAFLMPDSLLLQSTYKGFRELRGAGRHDFGFVELHDWSPSGKPFAPVGQNFYTYFLGSIDDVSAPVPVTRYVKQRTLPRAKPPILPLSAYKRIARFDEIQHVFAPEQVTATPISGDPRNGYLIGGAKTSDLPKDMAGEAHYRSRQGLEFLPNEIFELKFQRKGDVDDDGRELALFVKSSDDTAKYLLETDLMYPMIKGADIRKFSPPSPSAHVPFPYDDSSRSPIVAVASKVDDGNTLANRAPKVLEYLTTAAERLSKQSAHNAKIGGRHHTEPYSIVRVGAYTYGQHFVAFRDNTAWAACVMSFLDTPWGTKKRPLFQKHAVTISQRPDGGFISEDEAHYICAILNSRSAEEFVLASSDKRSFKIVLPFRVPAYDPVDTRHQELVGISRVAHDAVAKATSRSGEEASVALACEMADRIYRELIREPRLPIERPRPKRRSNR